MSLVRKPIVIRSKPLSTYEVADILGVSRKRTDELIAIARGTGAKAIKNPKRAAKANGTAPTAARRNRTRKTSVVAMGQRSAAPEQAVGD